MAAKKRSLEDREKSIHVMISNPVSLRRDVLTLTIEVIELLKKYESIKDLKNHKDELTKLLRIEVNAIRLLTKELNFDELPLTIGDLDTLPEVKQIKAEERKHRKDIAAKWREAERMGATIDVGQRAFMEETEALEAEEERKEGEEKKRAARMAGEIEKAKARAKEKPRRKEAAPIDKLEADLQAIRAKLARI